MLFQLESILGDEAELSYFTLGIYSTIDKAQKAALVYFEKDEKSVEFIISEMNLDAKAEFPSCHNQNLQFLFNAKTNKIR